MVIYKTIPVLYKNKIIHARKIGKHYRYYRSFILDYGEVPVSQFNEITGKIELVVNNRGRAYAARKRNNYRKKYKRIKNETIS